MLVNEVGLGLGCGHCIPIVYFIQNHMACLLNINQMARHVVEANRVNPGMFHDHESFSLIRAPPNNLQNLDNVMNLCPS